ncbi:DUF1501 domain-containing protein [Luteolibacter marinus]|uniref:DUF1501 domain-containing protein n=1 Tax=Luteolibacter marinus TaxID=2776705 RepID=UPI0018685B77|nr:DUF1501 domain-containing protein [Luteolibacter marinus]
MKASRPNPFDRFLSRRRFLGEASCAAVGTASLLSSILNLRLVGDVAAAEVPADDEYRALVCVFLAGGNDSFNMLAPVDSTGYAEYSAVRGSVAVPQNRFLPLGGSVPDGRSLGLNDSMQGLWNLYSGGKATFIANVGTLVEPTTLATYQNGVAKLPLGLFSHSDQQMHWQSSLPDSRAPGAGWGGRMGDLLDELNGAGPVSMNVSLGGINLFQSGAEVVPFAIGTGGAVELSYWNAGSYLSRRQAMESIMDAQYQNAFERAFAKMKRNAVDANSTFKASLASAPVVTSPFTAANTLSSQLQMVAKTIAARDVLSKKRQTFFVHMGGWDLHGNIESNHPGLLSTLSVAISEFQAAIAELELENQVTLFSASDFARTLSSNGSGTDHAWGGNQFVVGGAVNGGRIYGTYPELALGSSLDTGRGRLIPTTSVDEYFAELALWMGVSPSNLPLVLPNLTRFHDPVDGAPLGFLMGDPPP